MQPRRKTTTIDNHQKANNTSTGNNKKRKEKKKRGRHRIEENKRALNPKTATTIGSPSWRTIQRAPFLFCMSLLSSILLQVHSHMSLLPSSFSIITINNNIAMFSTKQDPSELISLIPIMWFVQYMVIPLAIWSIDSIIRRRSLFTWAATPMLAAFRYLFLVAGLAMIAYTVLMNSWVKPQWEKSFAQEIMESNQDLNTKSIAITLSIFGAACGTLLWTSVLFLKDVGYLMRGVFFRSYAAKQKTE